MATLEKLVKALESLKINKESTTSVEDEVALRRKKKVEQCSFVADTMCGQNVKSATNFASLLSFSMETLLELCDDSDSNIRMAADESLNRIIRAMMDSNVVKVHVELHKEIKKNGSVRSLRAALGRFAQLAHMIRPQKGKAYVQNLVPSLVEIAGRREELVLETLASSLPLILKALGSFTTDSNIRDLLKSFLSNLSSEMSVVRRTAATSVVCVCLYSRKPSVFLSYTLNSLVDSLLSARTEDNTDAALGSLSCLRLLLPHLTQTAQRSTRAHQSTHSPLATDRLIQVYELCLVYSYHRDHNVVTTALETLHQLLSCAPPQLLDILTSPDGLTHSRIHTDQISLSRRTLSELSVACSIDAQSSESPLLDTQDEVITDSRLVHLTQTSSASSQMDSASEESEAESGPVSVVTPILVGAGAQRATSPEADPRESDAPSPSPRHETQQALVWEIGEAVAPGQVALLHCCRRLVTGFLLADVRVSARTLALQCVSQLLRALPQLFLHSVDVHNQATAQGLSHVCDVTSLSSHTDPQIRGLVCVLVSSFLRSALSASRGSLSQWTEDTVTRLRSAGLTAKTVALDALLSLLTAGLRDESSTCVRHSLSALQSCLGPLLLSCEHQAALPVLPVLLRTAANPYWLVKVKLLEVLAELSYLQVYHTTRSCDFQSQALHSVVLALLADDDTRVRTAASDCLSRFVEHAYYPMDDSKADVVMSAAVALSDRLLSGLLDRNIDTVVLAESGAVESALSRVVHTLTSLLLQSPSKHLTAGCCEALSSLSSKFPPSLYHKAWHCSLARPVPPDTKSSASAAGLLGVVLAMLTESPLSLDLALHDWLLRLAGDLYTGLATMDLKGRSFMESLENKQLWSNFNDSKLANLSEVLLLHLLRLLCVFVRVLEDSPPGKTPAPSPVKRRPPRSSSPSQGEKEPSLVSKEDKGKLGQFIHIPHYARLYDSLKSAYANYKTQLECSDKLAGLLGSALHSLGQLLEFSTLTESGRVAEELLTYLRTVVCLEPTASVTVVQQLLKSLFGCNKMAAWEDAKESLPQSPPQDSPTPGLLERVVERPLKLLSLPGYERDDLGLLHNTIQREGTHRKASAVVKGLTRGSDRQALASYIRLFEPMVIQALKQYTVTNNVHLQVSVLSLLTQLVTLRVNYCLLDSDQIFIQFVIKQFEYLELGQIQHPEVLIPKIFEFLVHLSYEKNHSKPVISVAKVIQLCDGLMASGQDPLTHCIPALSPIVEHVFMTTSSTSAWQVKTQRDVVLAMLLRLVEYPQVLILLGKILSVDRGSEEGRRWSHQTADALMPLLAQGKVCLDDASAVASLLNLIGSFSPRTLSPPDPVLRVLFTSQLYEVEYSERSYATQLAMLIYLCGRDETSVLARLEDLKLCVREQSDDPLNASSANLNELPQHVFARLLRRTLRCLTMQLQASVCSCYDRESASYLEYLLAHLLLVCIHMIQSSQHKQIAAGFLSQQSETSDLAQLSEVFQSLTAKCPLVVVLWRRLVTSISLLSGARDWAHSDHWHDLLQPQRSGIISISSCLSAEIVQRGCLFLLCDFVARKESAEALEDSAWLVSRHLRSMLTLYSEPAVSQYLEVCRSSPVTSSLLLPALASVCTSNPRPQLVSRVLDFLVSVSLDDSGSVITILSPLLQHPHLVLARRAAALACSRVEYLLMLEREEVLRLLDQEDLLTLLKTLTINPRLATKHSGLVSLLRKLAATHYKVSPSSELERSVNTSGIHSVSLDKAWFLTQVRLRCCQVESARQCSQLLSQLEYADMQTVLRCQQFNNSILQHCFTLGTRLTLQERKARDVASEEVELVSPLYLAARTALFQHIHHLHSLLPRLHQVYSPVGRPPLPRERKYRDRLEQLFGDSQFLDAMFHLVPAVSSYLHSLTELGTPTVPDESRPDLAKFGVLCAEVAQWLLTQQRLTSLHGVLDCAVSVLRLSQLSCLLTMTHIGSITSTLVSLIHVTGNPLSLPRHAGDTVSVEFEERCNISLPSTLEDEEEAPEAEQNQDGAVSLHCCYQLSGLVSWLEQSPRLPPNTPACLLDCLRSMVRSLGRCSLVSWYCLSPPDTWPPSPTLSQPPPPLPTSLLQDVDLLRQVIFRISLLGWTSRTQFEETWMSLLTVLSSSPGPENSAGEVQAIMQNSSVAVQGITSLLVQTFLVPTVGDPSTGHVMHSSRDKHLSLPTEWSSKLETVTDALFWQLKQCHQTVQTNVRLCRLQHRCNVDRLHNSHKYGYGQVSIDFLKTAVMSLEERVESSVNGDYVEHEKRISESGLDLHSCLQFLLDLYSQWTQPKVTISLALLLEVVRSVVVLSDLFTERSHFAWLLDLCMELSQSHPVEDEILHQYLVVAVCKAAAVLPALENEVSERVLKLLESSLKSLFSPARVAAVHSLLYLLESYIHDQGEEQVGEAAPKPPDTRQRLLQLAKEHISRHFSAESSSVHSEDSQLVVYSLVLYIVEHEPQELSDVQSQLLQLVLHASNCRQTILYQALIQGLRRLVLAGVADLASVTRLALDRLNQSDTAVSLPALQLLLACLYAGDYSRMRGEEGVVDPEQMVTTLEKTSALFHRVKKGSRVEVECVCAVLPLLLADFFPASEVLSKVIGEFLSPHQPSQRQLSAVVCQVLSQACREDQLPLLQAWLVMSLHNFTQNLPVAMATWCLSCFFISASLNPWLRAMFPHVQSRMGKSTYEDRKLLCIAASDFYRQLSDEKQKEVFVKTFQEAANSAKSPFAEVIASL